PDALHPRRRMVGGGGVGTENLDPPHDLAALVHLHGVRHTLGQHAVTGEVQRLNRTAVAGTGPTVLHVAAALVDAHRRGEGATDRAEALVGVGCVHPGRGLDRRVMRLAGHPVEVTIVRAVTRAQDVQLHPAAVALTRREAVVDPLAVPDLGPAVVDDTTVVDPAVLHPGRPADADRALGHDPAARGAEAVVVGGLHVHVSLDVLRLLRDADPGGLLAGD